MHNTRRVLWALIAAGLPLPLAPGAALAQCFPATLLAPDAAASDGFGASVAISGDTLIVGAESDDGLAGANQGSAHIFRWSGSSWVHEATLTASDAAADDIFGGSVALSGETAIVGSHFKNGPAGANQGSAYVFSRSGTTWTQQAKLTASDAAAADEFGRSVALSGDTAIVGAYFDDGPGGADQGSAYVFTRSASAWTQQAKLTASDAAAGDSFGFSVAFSGDTAVVGAYVDDGPAGSDQGSAYVFTRSGSTWSEQTKLTASDAAAFDRFGVSVAFSGDTTVVGAYFDDGPAGSDQGSAYVFTRSGSTWSEQTKLTASDAAAGDRVGISVALSGDTAVVGAYFDDDPFVGPSHGSAYVFTRSGSTWTEQTKLTAPDPGAADNFGESVALSGDTAVVGAPGDDGPAGADQGSAHVFTRLGAIWVGPDQKVVASDAAANDQFGRSVALSGDTAVVGAILDDGSAGADQGSAYVFTRSGTTWTQQAKLTASDAAANDFFGNSVALSGDSAVVGAANDDGPAGADQGSAYVFTRSGTSWTQQAKLTASDAAGNDRFGTSVALSGDTAVVGAFFDDGPAGADQGSAYVFTRSGTSWTQQATLTASDAAATDFFGSSVALSGDTAVVGAYLHDGPAGADQGSAYVFTRSGPTWSQQAKLTASDGAGNDRFGEDVALSGDTAVVGAYSDDGPAGAAQGSAYVFTRSGSTWTQQAKLTASDAASFDQFGVSVALSGDTAVVGAIAGDGPAAADQGSAYVFTRSGSTWTQRARLTASDAASFDQFGWSVALSGDTAVVGANRDLGPAGSDQGSAWFFTVADEFLHPLVANLTRTTSHPSLAEAIFGAATGDVLLATPPAFFDAAPVNLLGRSLSILSTGDLLQPYTGSLTLADGSLLAPAPGEAMRFFGRVTLPLSAFASFEAGELLLGTGAQLNVGPGAYLDVQPASLTLAGEALLFSGATLGSTAPVESTGELTLIDATISAPSLLVDHPGRFIGSGNIHADLTNNSRIYFTGDTLIVGALVNNAAAVITVQIGVTTLIGSLTNNGTIVGVIQNPALRGGPSTQPGDGMSIQGDYIAGPLSALSMPDPVWRLTVAGDFDVSIDSNTRFDMAQATLRITGGAGPQTIEAMSRDIGPSTDGLDRTLPGHYPVGVLRIGPGASEILVLDARDNDTLGQSAPEAIYCAELILESGSALSNSDCKVYYGALINNGGTLNNPSNVLPLSDPCPADFNADGLVGSADLAFLLGAWGPAPGSPADLSGDNIVSAPDLALLLGAWGVCP